MDALGYLKTIPRLPASKEGEKVGRPSNGELKRWLRKGSVVINGIRPQPHDEITFPIRELVFFSCSRSKVTLVN